MKLFYFILLFLTSFFCRLHAQNYQLELQAGTFWDKGYDNFMYQRSTYAYTKSYNHASLGLLVSRKLSENFSILAGYNFSRRYLEVNLFSNNPVNSFSGTRIYNNSIPLFIQYSLHPKNFPGKYLFARLGGGLDINSLEYSTFGMYNQETIMTVTFKYGLFYTIYKPVNPVPFLQGFIGLGDQLGKSGNISLGIGYKYPLKKYTYEMYYYFDNTADINPELEETFVLEKQVSEITLYIAYSFGLNKNKDHK